MLGFGLKHTTTGTFRSMLERGDSLVLISDGVTDAMRGGREYGPRFIENLREMKRTNPVKMAADLLKGVRRTDDLTLAILKR